MKLYKQGKGKILVWEINQHDDTLEIIHGTLNGKMQIEYIEIEKGSQGRTIAQQAEFRMERKITMKLRSGYGHDIDNLADSTINQLGLKKPMKAHGSNYERIDYENAYVQRKYNGHRCCIAMVNGCMVAYGRGGHKITSIGHILKALVNRMQNNVEIDGELYIHGKKLQRISSKVLTQGVTAKDLCFICYDVMTNEPFYKRHKRIDSYSKGSLYIHKAETIRVKNFEEVTSLFRQFKNEGYEGAIVRFGNVGYQHGKRPLYTMKVKKINGEGYLDDEFKVIDILPSSTGWARLVCTTKQGKEFRVSAPGTHREKRYVLNNKQLYLGKYVNVEFPEWTEDKKPSQPVATRWRDKNAE